MRTLGCCWEVELRIVRIKACLRENDAVLNQQEIVCALVGLNDQNKMESGPWYGHSFTDNMKYPFMLMKPYDKFLWGEGYEEQSYDTNIGTKTIQIGELFSLRVYVYQILSVDIVCVNDLAGKDKNARHD